MLVIIILVVLVFGHFVLSWVARQSCSFTKLFSGPVPHLSKNIESFQVPKLQTEEEQDELLQGDLESLAVTRCHLPDPI